MRRPRGKPAAVARAMLFAIAMGAAPAFATDPINDLVDVAIPLPAQPTSLGTNDIRRLIYNGCIKRGWTPRIIDGDRIIASILVRGRHYAEVEISYDADSYSIRYKDSRELDYDAESREIHRHYNGWVARLSKSIQDEFRSVAIDVAPVN